MNVSIRTELLALRRNGVIVPERVLDWARQHSRSALHKAINWDPEYNINGYLLQQVRSLITLHIRTIDRKPGAVSLSIDRAGKGGGYREIPEVLSSAQLRRVMLNDALHEIDLLRQRFEDLDELALIWHAAARVREQIAPRPRPPGSGRRRGGEVQPTA